jgi:hypothetical protein
LPSASGAFVKAPSTSTASRANVRDDRDTPLSWVQDDMKTPVIWVKGEVKYFCEGGWTGRIALIWFEKFGRAREYRRPACSRTSRI